MSLRIILVFTAFIEDMLKLNLVCFFLFCYENELNDRTIIRTFRTPLVFMVTLINHAKTCSLVARMLYSILKKKKN